MTDPLGLIPQAARVHTPIKPIDAGADQGAAGGSFKDALMQEIEKVNQLQRDAQTAIEDMSAGRRDDFTNVMIAKQKADLAFQTLVQVRNKMVAAYEEIKQMRV